MGEWQHTDHLEDAQIENVYVKFKLSDLKQFFKNFDKWWLQINWNTHKACISYEGIDYEPFAFGDLEKMKDTPPLANDLKKVQTVLEECSDFFLDMTCIEGGLDVRVYEVLAILKSIIEKQ